MNRRLHEDYEKEKLQLQEETRKKIDDLENKYGMMIANNRPQSKYAHYLTEELAEALNIQLGLEQFDLAEELALMREITGECIKLYGTAKKSGKSDAITLAGSMLSQQLAEVVKTCEAAARVESHGAKRSGYITPDEMYFFVQQVVRCVHQVVGDDSPLCKQIEAEISSRISLPNSLDKLEKTELNPFSPFMAPSLNTGMKAIRGAKLGTSITPDMDVQDMDDSIPNIHTA